MGAEGPHYNGTERVAQKGDFVRHIVLAEYRDGWQIFDIQKPLGDLWYARLKHSKTGIIPLETFDLRALEYAPPPRERPTLRLVEKE